MNTQSQEYDQFQINLHHASAKLTACHNEKNVTSCLQCGEVLTCPLRENYVQAAYESMSKGQEGAFNFN